MKTQVDRVGGSAVAFKEEEGAVETVTGTHDGGSKEAEKENCCHGKYDRVY